MGEIIMRIALLSVLLLVPTAASAEDSRCIPFMDAALVSADGNFLGRLSAKSDAESVFNQYGKYGGKYQSESIWNPYGNYGSAYAANSAFNPYTSTGPLVVKDKKTIARMTKNKFVAGAVDPVVLAVLCFDYTPD